MRRFAIKQYASLVALPHSVFALPFALSSLWIARSLGATVEVPLNNFFLVLLLVISAVVSARTAAMGFNRIMDAQFDKVNPRTRDREIPAGRVSNTEAWTVVGVASVIFFAIAAVLGMHCLLLSPLVLAVLFAYSFTKRFTSYSHFVLGLALALAPGGAWWVLRPQVEFAPLLIMASVLFWVAGFDVLYSCQDVAIDKELNLHSVPRAVGIAKAMQIAKAFHLAAAVLFILIGIHLQLSLVYFIGLGALGLPFIGQHMLINPNNLSKINHSFFTLNGIISIGYLCIVIWAV